MNPAASLQLMLEAGKAAGFGAEFEEGLQRELAALPAPKAKAVKITDAQAKPTKKGKDNQPDSPAAEE